ncbi:PAS domain-containing sensor histidine kinase [Frigoriglobus tundricola]|uniref:PAS domain-containing protein n=1 Tax=Frigoriglobus tundricola TaxID=2774151 RepID=A0A6M5YWH9_9BACT|nr:PAS domain-containing sensor histidine kinase [Frigoriglobus tundricola]QJW97814.1 hypothetical protein FTUN_5394 [Frigoriglobus tundricola]
MRDGDRREAELADTYQADLAAVAVAAAALGDAKSAPAAPALADRYPDHADRVRAGFADAAKEIAGLRNRLASALRILNGLPDAVVVTDAAGSPRYLNQAAEGMFGTTLASAAGKPIVALLADPIAPDAAGADPDRPVTGSGEVLDWIRAGAAGSVVVRTAAPALVELTGAVSKKGARDALVCLVGRDLTVARVREAEERAGVRANATRCLLERYLAETDEPLRQVAAQLRLLIGDAKQSGQRDAMLAKLTAAGRGLRTIDTFHALAQSFRNLVWTKLPEATPSEFMAVEVPNAVGQRLAGRLKARGNNLKVTDQGGWLYADFERVEVALLGALSHACDATQNAQIEVRIRRLGVSAQAPEPATEFHIPDAGPVLTAAMLDVIENPFGHRAPAPLDRFEGVGGHPIGLVVAAWMAGALGGGLRIEADPSGQLGLRLVVPTRLAGGPPATVAAAAPGALDVAPHEETVAGWRLGAPVAQLPA